MITSNTNIIDVWGRGVNRNLRVFGEMKEGSIAALEMTGKVVR